LLGVAHHLVAAPRVSRAADLAAAQCDARVEDVQVARGRDLSGRIHDRFEAKGERDEELGLNLLQVRDRAQRLLLHSKRHLTAQQRRHALQQLSLRLDCTQLLGVEKVLARALSPLGWHAVLG
jgi:hypothetical protein